MTNDEIRMTNKGRKRAPFVIRHFPQGCHTIAFRRPARLARYCRSHGPSWTFAVAGINWNKARARRSVPIERANGNWHGRAV